MMPRKKSADTAAEQSARFRAEVDRMVVAGELNPIEADELFDKALSGVARLRQQWFNGEEGSENPS